MPYLTDTSIDSATLRRKVMRESDGACVVIEGVVRNHHDGQRVESIFYDAYRPMAEKEFEKVVRGVEQEFPGVAVAVLHRLGHLGIGDISISIACASAHRADAYAASRAVIDRVKETVPIWKKERGPDGEEWVGWQGRC
jgi:molybdopterin synthase catalytic subunit